MHDAFAVRGVQRVGDLKRVLAHRIERQRAAQRIPLHKLHDQVIRADVIERADVRMIQRAHGARFADEAFAEVAGHDFDGDPPPQPRIARLIHLAHAAGADRLDNFVRSQLKIRSHGRLPILHGAGTGHE